MHDEINLDDNEYLHLPDLSEVLPKVKFFLKSKTFWFNLIGLLVEVLSAQQIIQLPFLAFLQTPDAQKTIIGVIAIGNIILRRLGGPPLSFTR